MLRHRAIVRLVLLGEGNQLRVKGGIHRFRMYLIFLRAPLVAPHSNLEKMGTSPWNRKISKALMPKLLQPPVPKKMMIKTNL